MFIDSYQKRSVMNMQLRQCFFRVTPFGRHCCNLSGGVAFIVWFTTNGMRRKNKNIYAWLKQAITREIATHYLYCCLLQRLEALRTCRSGFPIAITWCVIRICGRAEFSLHAKNMHRCGSLWKGGDFVTTSPVVLRWLCDSPRTRCAWRTKMYIRGASKQ